MASQADIYMESLMGARSDLPRLYITLDPSKLVRCSWCGTLESENWIHQQGGPFCSKECMGASAASVPMSPVICVIIIISIAALISIGGASSFEGTFMIIIAIPIGIFLLFEYVRGSESGEKITKDSRRKEALDELSLLKSMVTHVECPNCDGNIDIATIGVDRVYHCEYCGASGIVEVVPISG